MITVLHGDCRALMPTLGLFDAVITDPPYEMSFMQQAWDGTGIAYAVDTWRVMLDALKPGAYMAAFGGTRTFHRMAVAIEDAGFEIRDTLSWIYGSGFPKSNTALKPSWEPIILARKPPIGSVAANGAAHGTGMLNIEACRIEADDKTPAPVGQYGRPSIGTTGHKGLRDGSADHLGRWPANVLHDGSEEVLEAFAAYGSRGAAAPASGATCEAAIRPWRGVGSTGFRLIACRPFTATPAPPPASSTAARRARPIAPAASTRPSSQWRSCAGSAG